MKTYIIWAKPKLRIFSGLKLFNFEMLEPLNSYTQCFDLEKHASQFLIPEFSISNMRFFI